MKRVKSFFKAIFSRIFRVFFKFFSPVFIPMMKHMAITGEGTNNCLKHGFLPVPINYYQPIPDIIDLEKRNVWDDISKMRGIKFEPDNYIEYVAQLAQKYADECNWPNEPSLNPKHFNLHNGCLVMAVLQRYLKTDFGWVSGSFWIKRIAKLCNG